MNTATGEKVFKPFLVEGQNIFRVVESDENVARAQIERLLEKLPIYFHIQKDSLATSQENVNEPLEVRIAGAIVSIYPPRYRIIACTTLNGESNGIVNKMRVDNMMDTTCPGQGQLRSCIHFDPKIFVIESWGDTALNEIELDIYVYPKTKIEEPKVEAPSFGKFEVRRMLELIAGGEQKLTVEQLSQWRKIVMYAVKSMRACYENPYVDKKYPVRVYYQSCWTKIEAADTDEKMIEALENLRITIECE